MDGVVFYNPEDHDYAVKMSETYGWGDRLWASPQVPLGNVLYSSDPRTVALYDGVVLDFMEEVMDDLSR